MHRLLEELFIVHYKDVYHYLYSLSRDASLSEDLAQEVFLEAIKSITAFRGEANIKIWLFSKQVVFLSPKEKPTTYVRGAIRVLRGGRATA